jgi:FAD/FMN-containing dehydrogenase
MQWYRRFIMEAPETINGFFALMTAPPAQPFPDDLQGKKVCGIIWCCTGTRQEANELFASIRNFKTPLLDWTSPKPFPVLQSLFDPTLPPGLQQYWKGDYVQQLTDEAIELHLHYAQQAPTWQSLMHLYPINGAASRIAPGDTAWNYRNATWATVIIGVSEDPAAAGDITRWAKTYAKALHPHCSGGGYVNFMMEEGEARIKAAYGANYDRLVQVKTKYDPKNLFCINQNIKPLITKASAIF